jgi:hypothetical protein
VAAHHAAENHQNAYEISPKIHAGKKDGETICYFIETEGIYGRSVDSLSGSRSGKSSSELSSLMVRNPKVGNSLEQGVGLTEHHKHGY